MNLDDFRFSGFQGAMWRMAAHLPRRGRGRHLDNRRAATMLGAGRRAAGSLALRDRRNGNSQKMLAGDAAVAIWNGVTPEARAEFYAWHLQEHMAERVGIPGFRRGRRFAAADAATWPEFFTLYEADTMGVLQRQDYASRLNAPTPWTRRMMPRLRDTSRGIARVVASHGVGPGGALLTLRFDAPAAAIPAMAQLVAAAVATPRVTGAHLLVTDDAASNADSAEKQARTDAVPPPAWIILAEATDAAALAPLFPAAALLAAGALAAPQRGTYLLEFMRLNAASG